MARHPSTSDASLGATLDAGPAADLAGQIRAFARSARRARHGLYAASLATALAIIVPVALVKAGTIPEWLGWTLAVVLVTVFGTAALRLTVRRAIAGMREVHMLAEAFDLELHFSPDDEERALAAHRLDPFLRPRSPADHIIWIMRGVIDDRRVLIFYYRDGSQSLAYASASISTEAGRVLLRAEHAGHAIAKWAGEKEVQFDDAAFDKRWWVQCEYESAARATLHADARARLMRPEFASRLRDVWAIGEGVAACGCESINVGELGLILLNVLDLAERLSPRSEAPADTLKP